MKKEEILQECRQCIANNQLLEAIDLLIEHCGSDKSLDQLSIFKGRHRELKEVEIKGTKSAVDMGRAKNVLRESVLTFSRSSYEPKVVKSTGTFKEDYKKSVAYTKLSLVFITNFEANKHSSISDLVKDSKSRSRKLVIDFIADLRAKNWLEERKEGSFVFYGISREGYEFFKKNA